MNPTSTANIEAVLGQIRAYQAQAQDGINATSVPGTGASTDALALPTR